MSQWRYVHLLFFVAFLGSWFLFALLWWLIIYYHGDFEEEHLPENQVFCLILVISTCLTYPHSHLSCCWPNHIDIFGWSSIIMETLKRNTCQRIRCLHLSHRSFLSHYLTTLTILTLTYPVADLHIAIDMFCNQHLSPLPGSKQLDAMRLANQQLCFCLPFQVTIPTKALLRNKQTQWN